MKHGYYTGKIGYKLYIKYADTTHKIYYAHPGNNKNSEPNLCHPTPFFDDCSTASTLSFVDIAVVNKETHLVELISEIEESGAEPKKVIGDIVNISLSDRVRIDGVDYNYINNLPFIFGVKANPQGGREEKIIKICDKLKKINELLQKKIELILVFDNDLETLTRKVENEICGRLALQDKL